MYLVQCFSSLGVGFWAAGWLALLPLFVSCGDSPEDLQAFSGSFVGRVTGTDAFVTVVTNGTDVRAYVWDGTPESRFTISVWFKGTQDENALDILSLHDFKVKKGSYHV